MSTMSLPGFTAGASLYKTRSNYQMARDVDQASGVSPQQGCGDIGKHCNIPGDCCTGWCNESHQCDCFDVGDECFFGSKSCCSGQCGPDGTCVPAPGAGSWWSPSGGDGGGQPPGVRLK
jgi:hypothetical protein